MTTHVTKEPVVLEGFQAILKPGEWGYKLSALLDASIVNQLEKERESALEWARSKAKNPKRVSIKPEPWEELEDRPGTYQVRFSWKDGDKYFPVIVYTEGTAITDQETPVYSGSKVKLAFFLKPWILPTGDIGTSLKLKAIQIVSLNTGAASIAEKEVSAEDAVELFGASEGFKVDSNPAAETTAAETNDAADAF